MRCKLQKFFKTGWRAVWKTVKDNWHSPWALAVTISVLAILVWTLLVFVGFILLVDWFFDLNREQRRDVAKALDFIWASALIAMAGTLYANSSSQLGQLLFLVAVGFYALATIIRKL